MWWERRTSVTAVYVGGCRLRSRQHVRLCRTAVLSAKYASYSMCANCGSASLIRIGESRICPKRTAYHSAIPERRATQRHPQLAFQAPAASGGQKRAVSPVAVTAASNGAQERTVTPDAAAAIALPPAAAAGQPSGFERGVGRPRRECTRIGGCSLSSREPGQGAQVGQGTASRERETTRAACSHPRSPDPRSGRGHRACRPPLHAWATPHKTSTSP